MNELFANFWFLLFASITITSVAATIAHAWQKVRRAQAEAALKKAMVERGLSVGEMERLLQPAALCDEQLVEKLANRVAAESASAETIQRVMEAFNAADLPRKCLLYHAIFGITDGVAASDEQLLAVVNGLCRPDGGGEGKWQDSEPKLTLPPIGTDERWDAHGIRAESGPAADRPRA